jgi:hypothetical protein
MLKYYLKNHAGYEQGEKSFRIQNIVILYSVLLTTIKIRTGVGQPMRKEDEM